MPRTRNGLPKHCSWNLDRVGGKRRVRFRKGSVSIYLRGIPWAEEFMRAYAVALGRVQERAGEIGASRTAAGSFNALCVSYYRSPEFRDLAASTQAVRQNIIERFRNEHGDKPIARLERRNIKDIIGAKANTPEAANNLLKVLRVLLSYATDIGMIAYNPAIGIKRYRSRSEGIHAWKEPEVAQFEAHHPIGSKSRLALALLQYTAQRRGDVIRMGWQHVKDDTIVLRQQKTGASLVIPIHPELMRVLVATPRANLTFLVTEFGKPFTAAGFGNWFRERCNEAGLPQCSAHGLRKCAATRLAEAGCSAHEIMAITGHKSLSQVAPYTRSADQVRLARQALAKEQKGSGKLSSTNPRFVQQEKKR
jgi:integrase